MSAPQRNYQSTNNWGVSENPSNSSGKRKRSSLAGLMPGPLREHGLGVITAAIFIVGEMAGSGVLALPKAVIDSGWVGLVLVVYFCVNSCYGGTRLGVCWEIIEERYPEHRGLVRNPYPMIAQYAVGKWGRILVTICVQITLFGAGVVYLLLASQIVQDLLKNVFPGIHYCMWFLIFAVFITPPMWLGSPKDFRLVGFLAVLTTVLSCIFIFVQIISEGIENTEHVSHAPKGAMDFFLAFGIILFSFGGASTFPTIQNDMIDRSQFKTSVYMGFAVILVLYLPISFASYFVFGDKTQPNIILSLGDGPNVLFANLFMALHLFMAFLIVVNPVCQDIENTFNVPHEFGMWRCVVRTVLVLLMVIVGESIPQFSKILALVGGSTITLLTFVLPNFFYMRLCDQKSPTWQRRKIPLHSRIYMWELILIGIFGGIAATYSAFHAIFSSQFSKPCYMW
uniref:Proton-coupled amino acid transporter 4 n=2 Tax=Lygus hesperus TaxID=30085 RepID=A0A0A9ZCL0_LYGHE